MVPISNITFEKSISVSGADYVDKQGFFFRAETGGSIKYDPLDNDDGDYITKTVTASVLFNDPVRAKKIYSSGTTATGIVIGKGV